MAAASPTWWEGSATDWSKAEPAKVVDVLTFAYATRDEVSRIALSVGLDWMGSPPTVSVRELWEWTLREAATANSVLDLAAVVLHDEASSQFHAPLMGLLGERLGEVNARIVVRYGLPSSLGAGRDAMVDSIVEADPSTVSASRGELQAITSVGAGLMDAAAKIQAIADLMARTVMIEVGGRPSGTGFLVGDHLILTAAHVLDSRNWPPSPLKEAEAVFDFTSSGRSYTETGTRVAVAEFVTGSLPTQAEADGIVAANWDAPADQLDFALLKLATPAPPQPAGPRGHYQLSEHKYEFSASKTYMIMQHPLGDFLKYSEITESPRVSTGGTRIRYGGNTLPGTSGAAIVDARGRLVGLHHFAGGGSNQGVPIAVIAQTLLNGPHAGLFQGGAPVAASAAAIEVDPFRTSSFLQRRPFVNRQNLRDKMRDMAEKRDGTRVLAINGESGAGVSYSYLLTAHVAEQSTLCPPLKNVAPGGLRALKIDLRSYYEGCGVDQVRTAIGVKLLLELGIIEKPTDPLAQEARNTLALVATIGARLKGSDKQWWLFFDGIDSTLTVRQGEVDELIHALIELAEDVQTPLRIVLAGRAAEQFAEEHTDGWAELDNARGLSRPDVDAWLRRRANEEQREIREAMLEAKLSELFPAPGPQPEPRWLARLLPAALLEVLTP